MLTFALRHIWADVRRALAVFTATVFAVTSFLVLTGAAQQQKLTVTDTANQNFRGAYDLLIRPNEAVLPLEQQANLYQSGGLTTTYGGITTAQLDTIRTLDGIAVAAPLAMVGMVQNDFGAVYLDVTELFPVGQERVLIRWKTTESARLGHVNFPGRWGYSYFTRQSIERVGSAGGFAEIEMIDGQPAKPCYLEPNKNVKTIDDDEKRTASRSQELQSSCVGKGDELPVAGLNPDHYYVEQRISSAPYLVAAIDPQAENQLLGLDAAITTGKSLSQCEPVITGQQSSSQEDLRIPILVSAQAGEIDRTMTAAVAALPPEAAKQWATGSWSNADARGIAFSDTPASVSKSYVLSNGDVWHNLRRTFTLVEDPATTDLGQIRGMDLSRYNRSNPLAYTVGADNSLTVTDKLNFVTPFFHTALNQDGGPRVWNENQFGKRETAKFTLLAVGEFDAAKINVAQESLGVSGAEGYRQPVILAGDEKSRNLVGERYLPTSSVADYAQPGPQLLIPIGACRRFTMSRQMLLRSRQSVYELQELLAMMRCRGNGSAWRRKIFNNELGCASILRLGHRR